MDEQYDHYIAVDWSIRNMAIARMTGKSNKISVVDVPSDVSELRLYLKNLRGSKALALEETTTSQWLYTELKGEVERLIICDPVRNHLLSEGAKTDKIDASKLVQLLRANLLKEVYHSGEKFLELRRLVSGYEDVVRAGVRLKNQRYSLLRACGLTGEESMETRLRGAIEQRVLEGLDRQLVCNKEEKKRYEADFNELAKKHPEIRHQDSLPGVGLIGAVRIVSRVVCPHRFVKAGDYLSYAGLVKLERTSGQVTYGRKQSRYCRELKYVYKIGAVTAIGKNNPINDYYEYLIKEKKYPDYLARHKTARRLANLSLGVFKSGEKYRRERLKKGDQEIKNPGL
ncbi:MAG: transposase [Deltaproteobacteria bacterium]|nr:transposase [Deltaproteobacteria bacterium]